MPTERPEIVQKKAAKAKDAKAKAKEAARADRLAAARDQSPPPAPDPQ